MKSTQATTYRTLNSELNRLNGSLDTLRSQAATGKKLLRPSDDPAAIRPVLSARTDIRPFRSIALKIKTLISIRLKTYWSVLKRPLLMRSMVP